MLGSGRDQAGIWEGASSVLILPRFICESVTGQDMPGPENEFRRAGRVGRRGMGRRGDGRHRRLQY